MDGKACKEGEDDTSYMSVLVFCISMWKTGKQKLEGPSSRPHIICDALKICQNVSFSFFPKVMNALHFFLLKVIKCFKRQCGIEKYPRSSGTNDFQFYTEKSFKP